MRGESVDGLMENPQSFLIGDFMQKIRVLCFRYRLCLLVLLFYFLVFKMIQTEIPGCDIDKRFCFFRHVEIPSALIKPDKCILCNVPGNSIFFRIFPDKTVFIQVGIRKHVDILRLGCRNSLCTVKLFIVSFV